MESSTIQSLNQINSDFYKTTYQYLNHTDWIYRLGWDQAYLLYTKSF